MTTFSFLVNVRVPSSSFDPRILLRLVLTMNGILFQQPKEVQSLSRRTESELLHCGNGHRIALQTIRRFISHLRN